MKKPFVAGNWKMNTDSYTGVSLVKEIAVEASDMLGSRVDVAIFPPFVYLQEVVKALDGAKIAVGGQDMFYEENGAFTGEISAAMLKDVGCNYVLCGHSERRHVIGEADELINRKVSAAISGGLLPVLCVGEILEQRQGNKTEQVVRRQVESGLSGLSNEKLSGVTIAYEPVWAIGTGLTATPEQAQAVHSFIRRLLGDNYGQLLAEEMYILYGGSVKPNNASELMAQGDIDGVLVGGASLKAKDFLAIIEASV